MGSGVGDDNNGVGLLSYGKQGENSGGEGSGQEGRIKLIDGRDADGNVTSNGNGDVLNDRGLLIRHGTDLAGAELDNRLTESMPPFLVLNYIIKL
jgi:hypothetical protein